jgi:hypothetical protein
LLGLGCPKQAFAKIATPRWFNKPIKKQLHAFYFKEINPSKINEQHN